MNALQKQIRNQVNSGARPHIMQYVKGKRGTKVGVLLAFADTIGPPEDRHLAFRVGYSHCKMKVEPFNSERGIEIALGRACKSSVINAPYPTVADFPHSMRKDYKKFVERCRRYFKSHDCISL